MGVLGVEIKKGCKEELGVKSDILDKCYLFQHGCGDGGLAGACPGQQTQHAASSLALIDPIVDHCPVPLGILAPLTELGDVILVDKG